MGFKLRIKRRNTGIRPCPKGHISTRHRDGSCAECRRERDRRARAERKGVRGEGPVRLGRPEPSPETIAEAVRAYSAPRTLTEALCGDPPKGRSSLDQKRQLRVVT